MEAIEIKRTESAFDGLYQRLVGLLTGRAKIDPILEVVAALRLAVLSFCQLACCRQYAGG